MYNNVVRQFFIYHEIDPESLSKKIDAKIYNTPHFLGVLSDIVIYKPQYPCEISIGDIYGCDMRKEKNIESLFDLLCEFYKEEPKQKRSFFQKKDEHCIRSNSNLMLGTEAMIERSNNSPEAISVCRVDNVNNINLIYTNGMHRYLALRTLYLKMLADNPEREKEIKELFKIKVRLNEIDEIKTFCFFIFRHYQKQKGKSAGYRFEYVNHEYTGRLKFAIMNNRNIEEEFVFDDKDLVEFIRPFIDADLDYYKSIAVPSFRNFLVSLGYNVDNGLKLK